MIVERATHPQFLSNTYLVSDGEGGPRSSSTPAGRTAAADRGGRAPRAGADPRAAHPPPLRPRMRGGRAARALAGARGADQPARARPARVRRAAPRRPARERARASSARSKPVRQSASARWRCARCTRPDTLPGCSRSSWATSRTAAAESGSTRARPGEQSDAGALLGERGARRVRRRGGGRVHRATPCSRARSAE